MKAASRSSHPERLHGDGAERDRLVDRDHQPVLPRAIEDREDALGVVHRVLAELPEAGDVGLDALERARLQRGHAAVELHALRMARTQLDAVLELGEAALEHPVHRDLV